MSKDITKLLNDWPLNDKTVNARIIKGKDGELQLQLRLDCGVMQMYLDGRPDGKKPFKCRTLLEYMERMADKDFDFEINDQNIESRRKYWIELDREMTQFYHRRLGLLTIAREAQEAKDNDLATKCYQQAAKDAEFTLRSMDFIRDHCEDDDNIEMHERFRPYVLWHLTVAVTQQKVLAEDFDLAVEQIKEGMGTIAKVYEDHGLAKWLKHDPSMAELRQLEKQIRKRYGIKATLQEQLQHALASEDYENAASIRDQLKAKGRFPGKGIQSPHPSQSGF